MKKSFFLLKLALGTCIAYCQDSNSILITPEFQQTPEWCWVTSCSMVLQYYSVPCVNPAGDYQCGLIGWYFGPNSSCYYNCFTCPVPAKSLLDIRNIFSLYPSFAGSYVLGRPIHLRYKISYSHLSKMQIKETIDNDSPILTGVNPSGFFRGISEHVTLIVGYTEDNDGDLTLTVNDPFPYNLRIFSTPNPYINAGGIDNGDGSYQISYSQYVERLQWHESFYDFSPN